MEGMMKSSLSVTVFLFVLSALFQPLSIPTHAQYGWSGKAVPLADGQLSSQQQKRPQIKRVLPTRKRVDVVAPSVNGVEQTKKRIALVIGNSKYADSPLIFPENDARDLAAKLAELGFEVKTHLNLTKNEMKEAISVFKRALGQDSVGLFYYTGHAIQVNGQNYLVPIDAILRNQADASAECVEVEELLLQMERSSGINIVILDAGRNNPFSQRWREVSVGLVSIKPPAGTLIAYAVAPGSVASDGSGRNSLYVSELIKQLNVPGLRIENVFNAVRMAVRDKSRGSQIPWEASTFSGDLVINPVVTPTAPVATPTALLSPEQIHWNAIASSNDPQELESYLRRYCPEGMFCNAAEKKLSQMRPSAGMGAFRKIPGVKGAAKSTASRIPHVERYPKIDCREKVIAEEEFAVQVSLTEKLESPQTKIEQGVTTPDQALRIPFRKPDERESWIIEVILSAPGFEFLKSGDISFIELPEKGDSTPALFRLRSKPIEGPQRISTIFATFWHEGKYIAKISREITVIRPAENKQPETPRRQNRQEDEQGQEASGVSQSAAPRGRESQSISPQIRAEPRSARSMPVDHSVGQAISVIVIDSNAAADLSVFLLKLNSEKPDEIQVIINSPYLQAVNQPFTVPRELDSLLDSRYRAFAQRSNRTSKIAGDSATPTAEQNVALMRGFGRELYDKFAPPAFKEAFWKLVDKRGDKFKTVQIYSNDPTIPWELMRPARPSGQDERDFLGLEFSVGRWHVTQNASTMERPPQLFQMEKLIVVAPQYTGGQFLPEQETEIKALARMPGYRLLRGNFDSLKSLFEEMPQGVVHFVGHGAIKPLNDRVNDFVIKLEDLDLDVLTWRGLTAMQDKNHPFFFFNACEVGQAQAIANFVNGWAPAVLEKGASGYIGALWPVGDKGAAEFAATFYETLETKLKKEPVSVGEVLLETRKLFARKGDPTFLAYVFYGDPNLRFWRARLVN